VKLIFNLFDEDRSGFLSEDEIREILKATHMQTDEGVEGKLQVVMKQVRARGGVWVCVTS
jgi:Ca2+-binding EF-hand superfamily protein